MKQEAIVTFITSIFNCQAQGIGSGKSLLPWTIGQSGGGEAPFWSMGETSRPPWDFTPQLEWNTIQVASPNLNIFCFLKSLNKNLVNDNKDFFSSLF